MINIDPINIDDINAITDDERVTTLIRSSEAARILGVRPATLYAYVSRGRLTRRTAPDGRTSLYARDDVERLAQRSRRAAPGPRPTIDVQITSSVTQLDEGCLRFRDHDVVELVRTHSFEDVAHLLWTGSLPPAPQEWPAAERADDARYASIASLSLSPIARLAVTAEVLADEHPGDDATTATQRLLRAVPPVLGSQRRRGPYAARVAAAWKRRPDATLVTAVDRALALLADHELATSTLAVRIAASVRASPYAAITAGLATIEGALHGSASAASHAFLEECATSGSPASIDRWRREHRVVPGFGHSVYRGLDPRFEPLMESVAMLDPDGSRLAVVHDAVREVGRSLPHQPNIDLALGALTWIAGLDPGTPIFAIARIAGWAAHYDEELAERPVRFRGVARPAGA